MSSSQPAPSRRGVLLGAGALAAAALAGCSSGGATAKPTAGSSNVPLPKYIPSPLAKGEIRSKFPGMPSAFPVLPDPLRVAHPKRPGDGTSMSMFTILWAPPPPSLRQNPYWQQMNHRLGLELKMIWGPSDSYDAKLATLLSSGDLPDVTVLLPSATSNKALRQGAFADLTEVLSGDKMASYPSLAALITEDNWRNTLIDGRIRGVVCPVPPVDTIFLYREDWARKLGLSSAPQNADELFEYFTRIPKAISKQGGRTPYGVGGFPGPFFGLVVSMFRAGPDWQERDGRVVSRIDTDAFAEAIGWCRKLWKAGGLHPDALALDSQEIKTIDMFHAGQLGLTKNGLQGPFTAGTPEYKMVQAGQAVPLLPPGHDGGHCQWVQTNGWFSRWGISAKAAENPKRVDTILSTLDWLTSPFGTEEYMFNRFGMEGRHWNYNAEHEPVPVDDARLLSELTGFGQFPHAYYFPGTPNGARDALAYADAMMTDSVPDPLSSLSSEVGDRVGGVLEKITADYVNQIVSGRRPIGDLDAYRKEYHARGGDQIIADLEKQLAER
ncbi:type 2 periplasmic-binding domain-containing protein [Flindersiella endophytica]